MAQFSMLHQTQTGTGDGASSYDEDQANKFFRAFTQGNFDRMGVIASLGHDLNELEVSGSVSPLSVASGYAIVYGYRYWNTASVNLNVTTPTGATGGRVILRQDLTLNTVRLYVLMSADSDPSIPALTQTGLTYWEIGLASFVIDGAGDIWTDATLSVAGVTDTRSFVVSPIGGMTRLRRFFGDGATSVVNFSDIQQDLSQLVIKIHGRSEDNPVSPDYNNVFATFNGDTGANYSRILNGGNALTNGVTFTAAATSLIVAQLTNANAASVDYADTAETTINQYATATFVKSALSQWITLAANNGGAVNGTRIMVGSGFWLDNSPITKVTLTLDTSAPGVLGFSTDTVIDLYGVI